MTKIQKVKKVPRLSQLRNKKTYTRVHKDESKYDRKKGYYMTDKLQKELDEIEKEESIGPFDNFKDIWKALNI